MSILHAKAIEILERDGVVSYKDRTIERRDGQYRIARLSGSEPWHQKALRLLELIDALDEVTDKIKPNADRKLRTMLEQAFWAGYWQ